MERQPGGAPSTNVSSVRSSGLVPDYRRRRRPASSCAMRPMDRRNSVYACVVRAHTPCPLSLPDQISWAVPRSELCQTCRRKLILMHKHVRTSLRAWWHHIPGGHEESISMHCLSQFIIFVQDTFLSFFFEGIAFYNGY